MLRCDVLISPFNYLPLLHEYFQYFTLVPIVYLFWSIYLNPTPNSSVTRYHPERQHRAASLKTSTRASSTLCYLRLRTDILSYKFTQTRLHYCTLAIAELTCFPFSPVWSGICKMFHSGYLRTVPKS